MTAPLPAMPAEYPPRLVVKPNKDGILEAVSLSFIFQPFPNKAVEYISEAEHLSLVEEAKAEAWREAVEACAKMAVVCYVAQDTVKLIRGIAKRAAQPPVSGEEERR